MAKKVISEDTSDKFLSHMKGLHTALLCFMVDNQLEHDDIPGDFNKCGIDTYGRITRKVRELLTEKVEFDKAARLAPFKQAISKAAESHMKTAQAAWAQVLALPAETRETLGLKQPTAVKVPVSDFAYAWTVATDMAKDLNEMNMRVVKGTKGDYIEVPFVAAKQEQTSEAA